MDTVHIHEIKFQCHIVSGNASVLDQRFGGRAHQVSSATDRMCQWLFSTFKGARRRQSRVTILHIDMLSCERRNPRCPSILLLLSLCNLQDREVHPSFHEHLRYPVRRNKSVTKLWCGKVCTLHMRMRDGPSSWQATACGILGCPRTSRLGQVMRWTCRKPYAQTLLEHPEHVPPAAQRVHRPQ